MLTTAHFQYERRIVLIQGGVTWEGYGNSVLYYMPADGLNRMSEAVICQGTWSGMSAGHMCTVEYSWGLCWVAQASRCAKLCKTARESAGGVERTVGAEKVRHVRYAKAPMRSVLEAFRVQLYSCPG